MTGRFRVLMTGRFEQDIIGLGEHIVERETTSNTPDDDCLYRFKAAMLHGIELLEFAPHTCRRSAVLPACRELLIPFGRAGYVVMFEIQDEAVWLLAVRHQFERDLR